MAEVRRDLRLDGNPHVEVVGVSPDLLPSRLAVLPCAVASISGCLEAAADLLHARVGRRPVVKLDVRHAAAAVRSEALLRDPSGNAVPGFVALSRMWRCADGWVRTHANYPWHRSALLHAFGIADGEPDEAERILAATLAGTAGSVVEELANRHGALAVAARNREQWRSEVAGGAAAAGPLIGIRDLAAVPRAFPPAGPLPASGLRVLDLTRVIAGPVGTRMLAALGAEVLRIDDPARPELPLHTVDGVIGKSSTPVDFGTDEGRVAVEALLRDADVLVSGYRPGALGRFGLEPEQVTQRHPNLIVATVSAWGPGPWEARRGFDSLVQMASGIGTITSADGDRPGVLPCQLLDHATGYLLAAGVLAALAARARSGAVAHVQLSLARTANWLLDQGVADSEPDAGTDVAGFQADLGNGWTAVTPPGRLDGRPLSWPNLPPAYLQSLPAWAGDNDQHRHNTDE